MAALEQSTARWAAGGLRGAWLPSACDAAYHGCDFAEHRQYFARGLRAGCGVQELARAKGQ